MMSNKLTKLRYFFFFLKYLFLVLLLFTLHVSQSKAQGASSWSEPVLLFQLDGLGRVNNPIVISDSYGNIHVFWVVVSESQGEFDVIYYTRLDAKGWTTPVDIITASLVRGVTATIGADDFIYLTWAGAGTTISYSRGPIQGAEFVKNWSEPVPITNANFYADLFTSASGNIYLAYAGVGTSGVFEQSLEPNSQSWSSSRMISQTSLTNTASDYVKIGVSDNGTMHVVWTEFYYPKSWPPRGIFYSRSIDGGNTWSVPKMMAGDGYDQINIVVVDDNNIHVAWNGMIGLGGRYHRSSSDGGQTWSETVDVIPAGLGGTEGYPQLVIDQSGTVHMLTSYDMCAWYTYLENQRWATPVCIIGAPVHLEEPVLALSEGNKLHAVAWIDDRSIWYTTKEIDAPWIPPRSMDEEPIQSTPSPISAETPRVTSTVGSIGLLPGQQLESPSKFKFDPGQILMLGLLPAILLIIFLTVLSFFKRSK